MKTKSADFSIKAVGEDDDLEEGVFEGYASVFGNVDSYGDVVVKGAFSETLKSWSEKGDTLPVLYGHDMADPFSNIGGVVEAKEDDRGLHVKAQLDLDNPKAAQVYKLLKGRRLNQMSFAFDVEDGAMVTKDGEDYYELRKMKLYEVSVVPIGANQETEILGVKTAIARLDTKSLTGDALDVLRDAHTSIGDILTSATPDADAEAASGETEAKPEELETAKGEEQKSKPSVALLQAQFDIL